MASLQIVPRITSNRPAHNFFICRCSRCQTRYFAWCDSPAVAGYDAAKWSRYDNPNIKDAADKRGFVSNGDLLACGHSLNQLRDLRRAQLPEASSLIGKTSGCESPQGPPK